MLLCNKERGGGEERWKKRWRREAEVEAEDRVECREEGGEERQRRRREVEVEQRCGAINRMATTQQSKVKLEKMKEAEGEKVAAAEEEEEEDDMSQETPSNLIASYSR